METGRIKFAFAYEGDLEDAIERGIRAYKYSSTSGYLLKRSVIIWAIAFACLSFIFSGEVEEVRRLGISAASLFAGALFGYVYRKWSVQRHYRNATRRELDGKIPYRVEYEITDDEVQIAHSTIKYVFPLDSLEEIKIDAIWLEAKFESGLCLLPLSAFKNDEERERFIAALKGEI